MDLSKRSEENIEYMLDKIKEKLRMVNVGVIQASHFNEEMYEDLKDIYELIERKQNFSTSEMSAIVEELSNLRK
ncbi:DUF1128 domain-containing protein [Bacillus solimangrovi]|uniref:UPF0435 protein BFG57_05500 n=1 Tax=Bacillus solimangrovi TaxID=1305675 RepID=A0A1E5LB64_9BACI|nr:DUF1128 domain-containing protein [Bacillus solimangrovi]OEH91322.1 hypothetical protein BFG57_05500 [Bacillus solimangrovi]